MRKLTTLLCLLALSISVDAQWRNTRQKAGGITQAFVTNSPGNSEANSKLTEETRDSSYYDWKYANVKFSTYSSIRNDGTPTSVAWFSSDGTLNRSPFPTLFNGDYNSLTNKPTIPSGQVQSDYEQANPTAVDYVRNKPNLSGMVHGSRTINGKPLSSNITLDKGDIGLGNADNTSDANKPVSSAQAAAIAQYSMYNTISKTASYTVVIGDWGVKPLLIVEVDATAGNVTITLPVPSAYQGRIVNVKRMDGSANTVTISGNGFNIDSYSSLNVTMQFGNAQIYSKSTQHLML